MTLAPHSCPEHVCELCNTTGIVVCDATAGYGMAARQDSFADSARGTAWDCLTIGGTPNWPIYMWKK